MLFGVIIIFLGVLFLLESIIPTFEVQFEIIWPTILIIISIGRIIKNKKVDICTSIIFLIGVWYLLYNLLIIPTPFTEVFWPIIFILFGVSIVWKNSRFQKEAKKSVKNGPMLTYYGVFSGIEEKLQTEDFKGANLYAIFGGIDLDISKVELKKDITINIYSIFGGTEIKLPENVNIKINASALFGSNENKANRKKKKKIKQFISILFPSLVEQR